MTRQDLEKEIRAQADPKRAEISQSFFKTGKGQYGEGDVFLGLTVPQLRKIAHIYLGLSLKDIKYLLQSSIHEDRFVALEILVAKYEKADEITKKKIVNFYLKNLKYVNNWDLVDTSAPYILGDYLLNKDKRVLYKLAKAKDLWQRRVAIVSTLTFIKNDKFVDTLKLAKLYLDDPHDLIHKATGWALREVGKKSLTTEVLFLKNYHTKMPRVMFRYAIERFDSKLKASFK